MQRIKIPIAQVQVIDRQRIEHGDIADLAESIGRVGLIQPIVLNQENRLIAGERRLKAAQSLGWTDIDVVYKETLSAADLYEMELIENSKRKDWHWTERCLLVAKIHRLKSQQSALASTPWGQRESGELLGMSLGSVSQCLTVAAELRSNAASPMWKAESMTDALRIILQRNEDLALAELAKRHAALAAASTPRDLITVEAVPTDDLAVERERYYSNPHNPPDSFESYWSDRQKRLAEHPRTIYLSNRLFNVNCLDFMKEAGQRFDHIITDPPYAIDMGMLDQQNVGMSNIESVAAEHDEVENLRLLKTFFPAAYACMKDTGFLVLWCDIMLWQFLYNEATAAGFKPQRWPIVWVKSHTCMNNAAQYNFTKNTELAMICRKGNATLVQTASTSVVVASHDGYKDELGHPFVKPFKCWEFLLNHCTSKGQTILEPFAGRGSGVLSMLRMERNVIACESNTAHFNALLEHTKQFYLRMDPSFVFK